MNSIGVVGLSIGGLIAATVLLVSIVSPTSYRQRDIDEPLEDGQWQIARDRILRMIKRYPKDEALPVLFKESHYRAALEAMEMGEWEQALVELSSLDPEYKDVETLQTIVAQRQSISLKKVR